MPTGRKENLRVKNVRLFVKKKFIPSDYIDHKIQLKFNFQNFRSSFKNVTVNIEDINDNIPLFMQSNYSATLVESPVSGDAVVRVMVRFL